MGNQVGACQNMTGQDLVHCVWTNGLAGGGPPTEENVKNQMWQYIPQPEVDAFYDYQVRCNQGFADPQHALICVDYEVANDTQNNRLQFSVNPDTWGSRVWSADKSNDFTYYPQWSGEAFNYYYATKLRIQNLCGKDNYDDVWPRFYHFYNSRNGKAEIDEYLGQHPDLPGPCAEALRNNHTDYVQRRYMLLNRPDGSTRKSGWRGGSGMLPSSWGGLDWNDPNLLNDFLVHPMAESPYNDRFWGNPNWEEPQKRQAFRKVMGVDVATGQDFVDEWAQKYIDQGYVNTGKSADDYFDPTEHPGTPGWTTDPNYAGQLPKKPDVQVAGSLGISTIDQNACGYENHCNDEPEVDKYLPTVAGLVGGGLGGIFVPGQYARVAGALTLGGTAYYLTKGTLGWQAVVDWFGKDFQKSETAALILSVGAPITVTQAAFEIGLIPAEYVSVNNEIMAAAIAGGVGYFLLLPIVEPLLTIGGGITTFVTMPLSAIEKFITIAANGCLAHNWDFNHHCKCENAHSKPELTEVWLKQIYGTTGAQYDMRKDCLKARMVNKDGPWGEAQICIGTCGDNGWMTNGAACITAEDWAYQRWDPAWNTTAPDMWNYVSPCLDINNPSFLPAQNKDKGCQQQHGEYFRLDTDGSCKDFRAPPGRQGPGQFEWPTHKDNNQNNQQCVIL